MNFTCVIPTFNQEPFLKEAVDSALSQTVPCEIIVVNDGSTDGTKFVLDEYEDKIKVVNQVNKGLPSARNTGIMNATGDWVIFLDSDDILEPNYVESVQKSIEELKGDVDVVAPSFTTFGLQNQVTMLNMRPTLEMFKAANQIGYCAAFKLSTLKEVGGYSPRMIFGYEDYHLSFNLLRLGKKIVTIPEPLWKYRVREGSMLSVAQAHHSELMTQIAKDNPGIF